MKGARVADALRGINQRAAQRLDALDSWLPEQKSRSTFDDYLSQATQEAARNPAFAQRLADALAQYRAVGG